MLGKIISTWALMAMSVGAYASSITITDSSADFPVIFNGVVEGSVEPGLSASATFDVGPRAFDGINTNWNFTIQLANTSSLDSRVSILGFDTNPDIILSQSTVTNGSFDTVSSGNMPQLGSLEVCLTDVNCAGGGGGGVSDGGLVTLMVELAFAGDVSSLTLDNFGVRYQSIVGSNYGDSGTGFGTVVPIPAALWMFLSALFGLVAMRRLRHRGESDKDAANADGVLQPA